MRFSGIGIEVLCGIVGGAVGTAGGIVVAVVLLLGEACWLQLLNLLHRISGDALAFGLEALYSYELLAVDFLVATGRIGSAIDDIDAGIDLVGEENETRIGIVADETLMLLALLHIETLEVRVVLIVGIIDDSRPDFFRVKLLYPQDIAVVMVVGVEVGEVIFTVLQDNEYLIVVEELTKELTMTVEVDALHIGIEPHLAATEGGMAVALERDAVDALARKEVALGGTALDFYRREVLLHEDVLLFLLRIGIEGDLDNLSLTIGIRREVHNLRAGGTEGEVVFAVAGDRRDVETLYVVRAGLAVAVHYIIYSALVAAS